MVVSHVLCPFGSVFTRFVQFLLHLCPFGSFEVRLNHTSYTQWSVVLLIVLR